LAKGSGKSSNEQWWLHWGEKRDEGGSAQKKIRPHWGEVTTVREQTERQTPQNRREGPQPASLKTTGGNATNKDTFSVKIGEGVHWEPGKETGKQLKKGDKRGCSKERSLTERTGGGGDRTGK